MGFMSILTLKNGSNVILRADSLHQLRKIRAAKCKELVGNLSPMPSPIIKDGHDFQFSIFRVAKIKNNKVEVQR